MPGPNRFRHQAYLAEPDPSSFELLSPPLPPPMASEVSRCRLKTIGEAFRRAGVRAIYLLHGTFVGTDALGLIRGIARQWPELAEGLYRRQKRALDTLAGDAGNFSTQYAAELQQALNREGDDGSRIPVRLFYWSSENHHVGRADAAIRLIDELASRSELRGGRVLLCGHSHGETCWPSSPISWPTTARQTAIFSTQLGCTTVRSGAESMRTSGSACGAYVTAKVDGQSTCRSTW